MGRVVLGRVESLLKVGRVVLHTITYNTKGELHHCGIGVVQMEDSHIIATATIDHSGAWIDVHDQATLQTKNNEHFHHCYWDCSLVNFTNTQMQLQFNTALLASCRTSLGWSAPSTLQGVVQPDPSSVFRN